MLLFFTFLWVTGIITVAGYILLNRVIHECIANSSLRPWFLYKTILRNNGPFAANGHIVQNPPCWSTSYTLGHSKQRKFKFDWIKSLFLDAPVRNLLSSMADDVTVSCKGPIVKKLKFQTIILTTLIWSKLHF